MMRWGLLLLLHTAHAGDHRGCHGKAKCHEPTHSTGAPRPTPAPSASDPRVRRADELSRWFAAIQNPHARAKARPLDAWTVSALKNISGRTVSISSGNVKQVLRGGKVGTHPVLLKGSQANHTRDRLGGTVYLEMVYLESLRGAPGIPKLYGAWLMNEHVWYATQDCGRPIGVSPHPGRGTKPTVLSSDFLARARDKPLELARALLRCFRSWATADFLLDDFKAQQFTLDSHGDVYLVDGPSSLRESAVGGAVYRAVRHGRQFTPKNKIKFYTGKLERAKSAGDAEDVTRYTAKVAKFQEQLDALGDEIENNIPPPPATCVTQPRRPRKEGTIPQTDVCPVTKGHHSCGFKGDCEAGARGAPESAGVCRAGQCLALGPWTHVYDVAARPWLLPGIARHAADPAARKVLEDLMARACAADPAARPTFDAMIAELERHI